MANYKSVLFIQCNKCVLVSCDCIPFKKSYCSPHLTFLLFVGGMGRENIIMERGRNMSRVNFRFNSTVD